MTSSSLKIKAEDYVIHDKLCMESDYAKVSTRSIFAGPILIFMVNIEAISLRSQIYFSSPSLLLFSRIYGGDCVLNYSFPLHFLRNSNSAFQPITTVKIIIVIASNIVLLLLSSLNCHCYLHYYHH